MKILYHHRTASKDGQAVHIEELITALRERGHEVRIVAPSADDDVSSLGSRVDWVHSLKANLPKGVYESLEVTYSAVAYRRLARAVREFEPDILYERYNLFMLAGAMIRQRFGLPFLLEVNAPLVHERSEFGGMALPRLARWAEGTTWRAADVVLPVTQVLAGHVTDYGVAKEKIVVIPNGINEAHFASAPTQDEAKRRLGLSGSIVLGFTGFVRAWHGVDRVVRWLRSDGAPANAFLLVVGDGPARQDLERLAESSGVRERVRFTGVVPRARVPEYVASFDVALQPAVVEYASPLKLFEYLALGKAIVAPRQPNIEEILAHEENALLFDPSSSAGLEGALGQLMASVELRERIARGAKETIQRRGLTWRENAKRIERLAEELVALRR